MKRLRRIVVAGVGVSLAAVAILLSFWPVLAQTAVSTPASPSATQQVNPAQLSLPSEPPAAVRGSLLFQQNCAPCHGDTGWGDGPTAADLPGPATAFADPDSVWARTPAELFHVTKFGRIEQLMPPWENRMDDRQIWQTVFYAWSLHLDEAGLEQGRTLYGEQCAACHGLQGEGDGPEAGDSLPSFADLDYAMTRSQADWHAAWQRAHADVGAEWSPAEQQQVLEAVRAFSYVPPWQPIAMHGDGVITGQVAAGTADATVPDDLVATLETYLQFEPIGAVDVPLDDAGTFRFEGLPLDPDIVYLVTVEYAGIRYSSPVLTLTDEQPSVDTDIFIYEGTSDSAGLVIDRVNWVIEPQAEGLLVGQILTFGYAGDRTYTGNPIEGLEIDGLEVEGSAPHVTVGLHVPLNAQDVVLENGVIGERYHRQDDIIYDTVPIGPGEATHQLVVRYLIPVDAEPLVVTSDYLYPVRRLNLLVAELPDVTIDAPRLEHLGVQEVQDSNFIIWQALDLAAEPVSVQFNGLSAFYRAPATVPVLSSGMTMGLGAGVVLLLLTMTFVSWRRGRLRTDNREASLHHQRNELLHTIARLDDLYAGGSMDEATWRQQRADLKVQLLDVAARLEEGKL